MTVLQKAKELDLEEHVMPGSEISYRGGQLKIDVSEVFPGVSEPIMGAYQNYLGGGIAGAVVGGAMFVPEEELKTKSELRAFHILEERIKKYFYEVNNGGGDEYMQEEVNTYEQNQQMPKRYPGL